MKPRVYVVTHPTFGDLRKLADSIEEAREWARVAFGRAVRCHVVPEGHGGGCICARCERSRSGE